MGHACSKLKVVVHPHSYSGTMLDYGSLTPQGIYTKDNDFDIHAVRSLIRKGHLAPFYKGLNEPTTNANSNLVPYDKECPICFLFYPSRVNRTICCNKSICTECFLQLKKRSAVSSCPFCVQPNLGVLYIPPAWSRHFVSFKKRRANLIDVYDDDYYSGFNGQEIEASDPDVVLIDNLKSNHEALNQEKRLSSVGTTRRRRVHLNTSTTAATTNTTTIQFTAANHESAATIYHHFRENQQPSAIGSIRSSSDDVHLEDIIVMEAIRLSYLTAEEDINS